MFKHLFHLWTYRVLQSITRTLLRIRNKLQKGLGLVSCYQGNPFHLNATKKNPRIRICEDRYQAFSDWISKDQCLSVIDIGCNQGYFLFRMAPYSSLCLGIEKSPNDVMYARSLAAIHRQSNVIFAEYALSPKNVHALPAADVTLCLSVFHHWVRDFGHERAIQMLRDVIQRCRRYFIFETGQYEEKGKKWTEALNFMQPNSHHWIETFLYDNGFNQVNMVGKFSTTVTDVPRQLYVAIKAA